VGMSHIHVGDASAVAEDGEQVVEVDSNQAV
jgi:hypothetical protein